jgi:NAD(P)-dependent dehydrogenase (short-subunit alcohol dehydrogenase family)
MGVRLKDKVTVITGAASGIGAGAAELFVQEGGKVIVADLQEDLGHDVAGQLGDAARFAKCDVTKEEDVAGAVDLAVSEFGRLDCIVNNAGIIGAVGPIAETDTAIWDRTMDILLRGVFFGAKHAARVMIPQESGVILSLSSTAGILGGLGPHVYTAAKHGVIGLTKSVASELGQYGIRVNAVSPGNTVTAMTAAAVTGNPSDVEKTAEQIKSGSPLGIAGFPIDIANALCYLASEEARYVSGHTLVVDAGQTTSGGTPAFHNSEAGIIREAGIRTLDG